jgi:hypothetical protein
MKSKRQPVAVVRGMNRTLCALLLAPAAVLLIGCGAFEDLREKLEPDLKPPVLLGLRARGLSLELDFDEPPLCAPDQVRSVPVLEVAEARVDANRLYLTCRGQVPGQRYLLELAVGDARGNLLELVVELYGFNPEAPKLLLNEFTTQGSDTHPDLVELFAAGGGDMAGLALYQGTAGSWDDRLVFPAFQVRAGEYLLVHFKPQGIPAERDEPGNPALSAGLDACGAAYDFWVPGGTGLSGNNGVISLYDRPGGALLDGVLYSNRGSSSDSLYRGFGSSATLARAEELFREGGWRAAEEGIRPEDAVNPDSSTATRSLCRSSDSQDSNSAGDWHVVPTRGFTFGTANSDERYVP